MAGLPVVRDRQSGLSTLLASGRLEVVLAALLAMLAVLLGESAGAGWWILLDVLAAVLAGLTARCPVWAGLSLGLLLIGYLFLPDNAPTMGEYAPLIPILGSGMRGQRRQRAWMSAGFGIVLGALTYRDYPADPQFFLGVMVWFALIGVLWLIGNLFTAYKRAQFDAAAYAVLQERLVLARELHDTTARTLARVLLDAQRAQIDGTGGPAFEELATGVRLASDQLRRSLDLLRAAEPLTGPDRDDPFLTATERARDSLERRGFPTSITIDGDLGLLPGSVRSTLSAALGEAVANVERHGLVDQPCAISVRVNEREAVVVVMNEVGDRHAEPGRARLGLVGLSERLSPLGGELEAQQEGSTWLMHITIPLNRTP
ncbi:MAG: histidine kinase [Propionicimonas sp.]|uniref:sensor histidine kinase n=1 Tax=Propionicimonas sp. TaxID=1955623 RepID=UPI003D12D103